MAFQFSTIHSNWTLFLDRDGVINVEKKDDYIRNWEEFQFYEESLEALPILARKFKTIVITTNQKGIGKGLMKHEDLLLIHDQMQMRIKAVGGRIDQVFYCPDLDNDAPNRKPQPGMAFQAKASFPSIQFDQSIMVGNRMSDMQFGRNLGMFTIWISSDADKIFNPDLVDLRMDGLKEVANLLK
jgi:histidinol-phosphate phosphatase family protein